MTRTDRRMPLVRGASGLRRDSSGYVLIIDQQEETYTVRIHFVYLGWSAEVLIHHSPVNNLPLLYLPNSDRVIIMVRVGYYLDLS